jgi:predicted nuclease of predicted toxin-antitoxin system
MTIGLYMDEHIPRAITIALRLRAVDVLTVQDDGRQGAADRDVMERANELGRVLFSRDVDLLVEAQHRQACSASFIGLICAHQLRASVGDCVSDLELIAKTTDPEDYTNQVLYLPL